MTIAQQKKMERLKSGGKPRVLDLFAGAGGLSLGFQAAGFDVVAAVEWDPQAARTHATNFFRDAPDEIQLMHGQARDITKTEPETLMREYGYANPSLAVDLIIGGPPCQAFSRVGRAKLRKVANHPDAFLQDPRASLYLRFLYYIEKLQPLAILMENVSDALNHGGTNIAQETCNVLKQTGYICGYSLLNSAFYGVPQMRERMFLMAFSAETGVREIFFPQPTHRIELPRGYQSTRNVALQAINHTPKQPELFRNDSDYIPAPQPGDDLPKAVSVQEALGDLPPIYALELLEHGKLSRGIHNPANEVEYPIGGPISNYGQLMRYWPRFETQNFVTGHIVRYLPRDFKLFARLAPGDQYPEAVVRAKQMLQEELDKREAEGVPLEVGSKEYKVLEKKFVPPYDPGKFPNKWRKMEADLPARTLMAHIGKDSYSHIHYDNQQARTISIREAARIQSFPDGFLFSGMMNAAFKQAGNAVPVLLAYHIARQMMSLLGQEPDILPYICI